MNLLPHCICSIMQCNIITHSHKQRQPTGQLRHLLFLGNFCECWRLWLRRGGQFSTSLLPDRYLFSLLPTRFLPDRYQLSSLWIRNQFATDSLSVRRQPVFYQYATTSLPVCWHRVIVRKNEGKNWKNENQVNDWATMVRSEIQFNSRHKRKFFNKKFFFNQSFEF